MTPNFTITSGADSYSVDIDIISPSLEYFRRASKFGTEASEEVIALHGDAPAMVDIMTGFLHNADYHPTFWKPDMSADSLMWVRAHGRNMYASCKNIDRYGPHSGDNILSPLSTHSPPNAGVASSHSSNKQILSTLDKKRSDTTSLKRQRVVPSIPSGSGLALYHRRIPRHMLLDLWIEG